MHPLRFLTAQVVRFRSVLVEIVQFPRLGPAGVDQLPWADTDCLILRRVPVQDLVSNAFLASEYRSKTLAVEGQRLAAAELNRISGAGHVETGRHDVDN